MNTRLSNEWVDLDLVKENKEVYLNETLTTYYDNLNVINLFNVLQRILCKSLWIVVTVGFLIEMSQQCVHSSVLSNGLRI